MTAVGASTTNLGKLNDGIISAQEAYKIDDGLPKQGYIITNLAATCADGNIPGVYLITNTDNGCRLEFLRSLP